MVEEFWEGVNGVEKMHGGGGAMAFERGMSGGSGREAGLKRMGERERGIEGGN